MPGARAAGTVAVVPGSDPFELALESAAFDAASWSPLPVRSAVAPADAVPALLAWAAREGAWFEPIELAVAADGNRTVHARRVVAAGELLIAVPRRLMITDDDVALHPRVAPIAYLEGAMLSPPCTIGVWLALEQAEAGTPWRRYLDALPPTCGWMAVHAPAARLAALAGTRALSTLAYRAAGHRADHALVTARIPGLADLPLADHVWGRHLASSRCFRIETARGSTRALVPVADMLDHGRVDARWSYVEADARFEVRAARDLAPGDEIQISYGPNGNAALVASYGFAIDHNADDEVLITVATPDGARHLAVGTRFDRRFELAVAVAGSTVGPDDDAALARLALAVRAAKAALAAAPRAPADDPAWQALCERVLAGERAVAAAILEFLDGVAAGGSQRPAAAWQRIVDEVRPDASGSARLLRELALVRLDE